jgi:hypothetical protein
MLVTTQGMWRNRIDRGLSYFNRIGRPALPIKRARVEPAKVSEGTLFVKGDDRGHSYDGRFWRFAPLRKVAGVPSII